ncbi:phospholipase D family protein [Variovorax sp. Sphag1AA]|uniref:phospholipase D family protein n=1 Tax=Variovorax sp. Sphag1AA TaxID=2587027 RepID=UPI00161168DC|nr:phospholipase D family protein [Variovorax sp. Sphag1AA]MBB3182329.1 phosphatidylserine/phosphatidylglycerophosphate/cardiolipin synthase-like enzyme [Variovorax sp. Sphag1AA]
MRSPNPFRRLSTTLLRLGAALGMVLCLSACAELPKNVERPISTALESPADTPLALLVKQRREAAATRFDSGFLLVDGPPAAYGSRLALAQGAQKTLDLQYYSIHADASTAHLLRAVRDAARRGVRVRILLDDFHSTGRDAVVMYLAFEPNIEMRMFNPLAGARTSTLSRLVNSIDDASRIQQRMHNKLFVADNVLGVTGGRNLGDAYFGNAPNANFLDLDVLVAGRVVQDLSRSFDAYWNNERAYPVESLVKREELEKIRADAKAAAERERTAPQESQADEGDGARTDPHLPRWDRQPMDLRTASFIWAPAAVIVDKPAKIPSDRSSAAGSERKAPGVEIPDRKARTADKGRSGALQVALNAASEGDTVVEGLLQLIGLAKKDLLIISPYFVPGPDMKQAFAAALSRGVRIRVLTNSLASNDAPVAHVGYARHREELLKMGVELYELRSEQAGLRSTFGSSGSTGASGESRSMLHSKGLVMDGEWVVVGSMNLDLRSQLQNTEIAVLIRSNELARVTTEKIETTLREGSWHVEEVDGRLVWHAPQGSGLKDETTEPDASPSLRLMLKLFGPLAPDTLL